MKSERECMTDNMSHLHHVNCESNCKLFFDYQHETGTSPHWGQGLSKIFFGVLRQGTLSMEKLDGTIWRKNDLSSALMLRNWVNNNGVKLLSLPQFTRFQLPRVPVRAKPTWSTKPTRFECWSWLQHNNMPPLLLIGRAERRLVFCIMHLRQEAFLRGAARTQTE